MKTGVVILARANFGRWPDKVLYQMDGMTILEHTIRKSKKLHVDHVIVSTTSNEEDHIISKIALKQNVNLSYGPPHDRCARYCQAIIDYDLDYYLALPANVPFFDIEYQNIVIDCIPDNPGHMAYSLAAMNVGSFVWTVYSAEMPLEMMSRPDRDQEFSGDTWIDEFYLKDEKSPEMKNLYPFNANIAYKIEARMQREICEYLGHFPKNYDEILKALKEIE